MPIIVIKGGDHSLNKKLNLVLNDRKGQSALVDHVQEDDQAPSSARRSVTFDMEDILDFKVYRVSKPNFIDGSMKTKLVGEEVYYNEEQSHVDIATVQETKKPAAEPDHDQGKPTLLQKFRAYRSMHPVRIEKSNNSFLASLHADERRFKMIKAGQSLAGHVHGPTLDETLIWAIQFVTSSEQELVGMFLELAGKLKAFEQSLTSGKAGGNSVLLRRLPSSKLRADGTGSKPAAGGLTTADHTTKNATKSVSLAQQLEFLKSSGADHFLKAVGEQKAPPSRQNSSRQSNNSGGMEPSRPSQGRRSNNGPRGGRTVRPAASKADQIQLNQHNPHSQSDSSQKSGFDQLDSTDEESLEVSNLVESVESEEHMLENIPEAPDAEDDWDTPETEDRSVPQVSRLSSIKTIRTGKGKEKAPFAPTTPKSVGSPRTPNNKGSAKSAAKTPRGGRFDEEELVEECEPRPAETTNGSAAKAKSKSGKVRISEPTKKASKFSSGHAEAPENEGVIVYEQQKKTQEMFMKSMKYTLDVFQKTSERYQSMYEKAQRKLRRVDRHGNNLLAECEDYAQVQQQAEKHAKQLWEEKQFNRLNELTIKAKFFSADYDLGSHGASAGEDIRKLRLLAEEAKQVEQLKLLHNVKWYVTATARLRDHMKRMNNSAPLCCLKFVLVMRYLITLGFAVSIEIFHRIILSAVFLEEDFRKNIVNQIIDVVRAGLGISAEEFLSFLESNNIQPPPELMNEIRLVNQQKSPTPVKIHSHSAHASKSFSDIGDPVVRSVSPEVIVHAVIEEVIVTLPKDGLMAGDVEQL